jgi:hypothetical protein
MPAVGDNGSFGAIIRIATCRRLLALKLYASSWTHHEALSRYGLQVWGA